MPYRRTYLDIEKLHWSLDIATLLLGIIVFSLLNIFIPVTTNVKQKYKLYMYVISKYNFQEYIDSDKDLFMQLMTRIIMPINNFGRNYQIISINIQIFSIQKCFK